MRALGTRRRGLGQDSRGLLSAFTQGFPGHTLLTVTRPGSTEVSMAENRDITEIEGYHAHVYYDADTKEAARVLCEATRDRFGCNMGRMHERPVGPHPMWSCQLAFPAEQFAEIIPWLTLNRGGLTIFIHAETDDVLADHTHHTIWMGTMEPLNLDFFGGDKT